MNLTKDNSTQKTSTQMPPVVVTSTLQCTPSRMLSSNISQFTQNTTIDTSDRDRNYSAIITITNQNIAVRDIYETTNLDDTLSKMST